MQFFIGVKHEMNKIKDELKSLYRSFFFLHAMLAVFFCAADVPFLLYMCIIGMCMYLLGYVLLNFFDIKKICMYALVAEMITASGIIVLVMGWQYGFTFMGIMAIPIIFFVVFLMDDPGRYTKHAIAASVIDVIAQGIACLVDKYRVDANIADGDVKIIFITNATVCAIVVGGYLSLFIDEIGNKTRTLRKQNLELDRKANFDSLTNLYNRQYFYERAQNVIKSNPRRQYVIVCTDIWNFKLLNDLFGEDTGDKVLEMQSEVLRELLGRDCVYGRIGGDTFAICMPKDNYSEEKFITVIDTLRERFNKKSYHFHMYIGVCDVRNREESINVMCDRAIFAIDNIKGDYQKIFTYYDADVISEELRRQRTMTEFAAALEEEQFQMYLQPQIDKDNVVYGAEALVRWLHPKRGLVMPGEFVEFFEEVGLIHKLDEYIWNQAAKQLAIWKQIGYEDWYISVNISVKDFYYLDIYNVLVGIVQKYDIEPKNLRLEITETALVVDSETSVETVKKLRKAGFILEIDDFGSGYSSLNMLKDFDVDVIKIDRQFLAETENEGRSKDILATIIELANRVNMEVITEGVETRQQIQMLSDMGCNLFQGYYFSKPISVDDYERKYMKG